MLGTMLALQAALILSHVGRTTVEPHQVPFAVQGTPVVAQAVAERLNRVDGTPVHAAVLSGRADPRGPVRDGLTVATLVIDVTAKSNHLYLSSVNDPDVNRLARDVAEKVGATSSRATVDTQVSPRHHPGLARGSVYLLSSLWIGVGFLVGLSWALAGRSGRMVPARRAWWPVLLGLTCCGLSLAVAGIAAASGLGSFGLLSALGFLGLYAAAIGAATLESVFGVIGMAVASTVFVFFAAPLYSVRDPRLLPSPWRQATPWTPHGATLDLTLSLSYFGTFAWAPALVLGGVILLSVVTLVSGGLLQPGVDRSGDDAHWRLRVLAVVIPTAMAVVAAVVLAPAGAAIDSPVPTQKAAETQCLPTTRITSLKQLNQYVLDLRAGSSFQGADVGADALLQDGRRLWVFGDTLRSADFEGQRFVRNSMLVFGSTCLETVLPASHGALIPDRDKNVGYWPMSIARVQRKGYDLVGVGTQRVRSTSSPDGAFAFEALGPSVAIFVVVRGKTPQLLLQKDLGPDKVDDARPMWGAAATVSGGWVYVYGTAHPDTKGIFGFSLRVARTRVENLIEPKLWQYWDGRAWQGSASRATELIGADGGVSQTLSVFHRGNRWYALSKRDEFLGSDLVVWSAPNPTGPFDAGTTVAHLPSDMKQGSLRYMPLAHPDLIKDPASVIVSYSRNNTDTEKVEEDPFLYRPQFLRISLPPVAVP